MDENEGHDLAAVDAAARALIAAALAELLDGPATDPQAAAVALEQAAAELARSMAPPR